jgi:glycosyltransferase involved in cell wall biosynthesis
MLSEQPFISIIIPALNSIQLPNTLHALARQTSLDLIKEIIVVGQQEVPEWFALQNAQNIRVDSRPTPAHNRNTGAQTASGTWLVFTDSDCLPKPNWIEQLAAAISPLDKALAGAVDLPVDMS